MKSTYDSANLKFQDEILIRVVDNGWMLWLKNDYDRVDRPLLVFNDFDAMVACLRKHFNLRERAVQKHVPDEYDSQDD